jgi:hypothetical protein
MLFTCNNNKEECDMNTGKHMILFNKGSFDIDSLVQKHETNDNNRAGFIGESVLTLAFLSKVLCRGLNDDVEQHYGQNLCPSKLMLSFPHPCWTIDAFQFPKQSIASVFLIHCFQHDSDEDSYSR